MVILDSSDLQLPHGSEEKWRKTSCHEQWLVEHKCYNYIACLVAVVVCTMRTTLVAALQRSSMDPTTQEQTKRKFDIAYTIAKETRVY